MTVQLQKGKIKRKLRHILDRLPCPDKFRPSVEDAYQQRFLDLVYNEHIRPAGADWCSQNRHRFFQLGDYVQFLSFGHSEIDEEFVKQHTTGKSYLSPNYPIPEMELALQEAVDLTRIWKSDMGFGRKWLFLLVDEKTHRIHDELIEKVAREAALDVLVENYYEGVPVEDLIA